LNDTQATERHYDYGTVNYGDTSSRRQTGVG
jgi:hypothetical protein